MNTEQINQAAAVTEAATQTNRPCYYRVLKSRRTVATDVHDLVQHESVAVATDVEPTSPVNEMDFVYDVAMDMAGATANGCPAAAKHIIEAPALIEECIHRVNDAYHAWLDVYNIHGNDVAVQKTDGRIVFFEMKGGEVSGDSSSSKQQQQLPLDAAIRHMLPPDGGSGTSSGGSSDTSSSGGEGR